MNNRIRTEKRLCAALRHRPEDFSLVLDDEGFTDIADVCESFGLSREELETIVELSDKKRFEIKGDRIRALYGHSVLGRIEKEEMIPPEYLFHGTGRNVAGLILKEGLKPMKRQYVHLSYDTRIALEVGRRKDSKPVILQISAYKAHEDGVKFYSGNERTVLADHIPPQYIKIKTD